MESQEGLNIAIIGQGVIGISTALAIKEDFPSAPLTIFCDCHFKDTCSYGPAGLWGPHFEHKENKKWAEISFNRFAKLQKEFSPETTGVTLVSGYLESDSKEDIEKEERLVSNVAYNFKWLKEEEINSLLSNQHRYACHYTSYAAEGRLYVPWMVQKLESYQNVNFQTLKINSIQNFVNSREGSSFDVVINCTGLQGGKLAGDDDSVYPIRGVLLEVDLPYQRHFRFNNLHERNNSFTPTYVIPMVNSVLLGGLLQENRSDLEITDEDREDIWQRNVQLQPALKVIHNYGHSSNGFTLAWGCAQDVVKMVADIFGQSSISKPKLSTRI